MPKKNDHKANSAIEKKGPKSVIRMVPLFSWRTILVVTLGVIIGAGLGLGYWIISPSLQSSTQAIAETGASGGGFAEYLGTPNT